MPCSAEILVQSRAFFSRYLLSHRRRFRDIRRSFRGSIYRSTRILSHSLTRSEEAASENRKRGHDGECSSYLFHSATSLRLYRVLASESSRDDAYTGRVGSVAEIWFLEAPVRSKAVKTGNGRLGAAQGRPLICNESFIVLRNRGGQRTARPTFQTRVGLAVGAGPTATTYFATQL